MKAQFRKVIPAIVFLFALNAAAVTRYVDLNSSNPTPPYTNWLTAATNIQDAVDGAVDGETIFVTNGIYAAGGRVVSPYLTTNRVVVDKAITLQSVNGPEVTVIRGNGPNGGAAVRCVYMTPGAILIGFTLTNGATQASGDVIYDETGGGVWCASNSAVVSNCIVTGNSAHFYGGGAYKGTLNNCTLKDNWANYGGGGGAKGSVLNHCRLSGNYSEIGGGADGGILNNCVLIGNSASSGGGTSQGTLNNCTLSGNYAYTYGGAYSSALNNCIVYYNTAGNGWNYNSSCTSRYCCTTPLPSGAGNFTNQPLFVDTNGWSNLRLSAISLCINAGNNSYATNSADFDGNPRIVAGTVDIGAYEFQSPSSVLSYVWAHQFGFPTDGSVDFADVDGDGMNSWQEWRADTIPTNALSVLQIITVSNAVSGLKVVWQSASTRNYWLERATNFSVASPFQTLPTNIAGVAGTKVYTDITATNGRPYFYRVGVQ